ncbi:hypothetical protein [Pedobacter antarcticus]|uniref:hypothetical protein n=1 Tax=Pedobacter antarcticus TaxID=34086 RepID=UPI00292FF95D|nr:hypothetical protein [Pedobacter antarcticus]
MKKMYLSSFVIAIAFTLCSINSKAQTGTSGPVALTISIEDAISITLGGTPDVLFEYHSAASFNSSPNVAKTNHFTVVSNRAYTLGVNADAPFTPATGTSVVPLSTVQISVTAARPAVTGATTVALDQNLAQLVATAPASTGTEFDINYNIPTSASQALITAAATDYTTNVLYTVTQL